MFAVGASVTLRLGVTLTGKTRRGVFPISVCRRCVSYSFDSFRFRQALPKLTQRAMDSDVGGDDALSAAPRALPKLTNLNQLAMDADLGVDAPPSLPLPPVGAGM